jgi:hypothetical protein
MSELSIPERVARGAAALDERKPGWNEQIDLDVLDLNNCNNCILGQLYGHYAGAPQALKWLDPLDVAGYIAPDYGFDRRPSLFVGDADYRALAEEAADAEYDALTEEWRRVITARRSSVDAQ